MKEILGSISSTITDKLSSSLTGTFILSWIAFHWRFIYTAFFVDQDKIFLRNGMLKDEYLLNTYFDFHHPSFWIWLAMPLISTYLVIWVLPKLIFIPAHKKNEEYETEKSMITLSEKRRIEKEKARLEEEQILTAKATTERVVEEKKAEEINPRLNWDREFDELKKSPIYEKFTDLIRCIYNQKGFIETSSFRLLTEVLVYSDANELTIRDTSNHLTLTDKGKYFVKRYTEAN